MSDLISKEKLKNDMTVLLEANGFLIDDWLACCVIDIIDEQPTIEAEPIKHARWIDRGYMKVGFNCSACGAYIISGKENFCPNCGADIREVEE